MSDDDNNGSSSGGIMEGLGDATTGGSDSFTETSSKSWFERILDSLKAILFGIVLVIAAGVLMFWNEGRSAKTAAALSEGAGAVVATSIDRVDTGQEGKLVHLAGATTIGAAARDADFGFDARGLRLIRKVEMFQWKEERSTETQKKLGGGEETITRYTYSKEWSDQSVDSSRFRNSNDHRNPAMPAVSSRSFFPSEVKLGAFTMSDRIIGMVSGGEKFAVPDTAQAAARSKLGQRASVRQGDVYVGSNPDQPAVGDVRISWTLVPITPISVVGRQTQNTVTPWTAKNGNEVLLVEAGVVDPALMFKHGEQENSLITWILRAVGVLVMFIGFRVMLSLLEVLADVIPFIGNIVGAGASLVALLCTLALAPVIIAIAWFVYRPVVAIAVLVIGGALVYGLRQLMHRRVAQKAPQQGGLPGAAPG